MGRFLSLSLFTFYLLMLSPLPTILWYGQPSFICFYLLFLYFYGTHTLTRSLSLAIGLLLKPHFFVFPFLFSLLRRHIRLFSYTLGFIALFNVIPICVWGPIIVKNYFRFLKFFSSTLYPHMGNQSLISILWRWEHNLPLGYNRFFFIIPYSYFWLRAHSIRICLIIFSRLFLYKEIFQYPIVSDLTFIFFSLLLQNFLLSHYLILYGSLTIFYFQHRFNPLFLFPLFLYPLSLIMSTVNIVASYILFVSVVFVIAALMISMKTGRLYGTTLNSHSYNHFIFPYSSWNVCYSLLRKILHSRYNTLCSSPCSIIRHYRIST